MKYLKLLTIGFFLFYQNIQAQTQPYLVRAKCYGGSGDEKGEVTSIGPNLTRTPDNFILITGLSNSSDGDIGSNKGGADIILIKTDTSGNVIWTKNYGGSSGDGGCNTYVLPDLDYLIIGNTSSNNGDVVGFKGVSDIFILKVDHNSGSIIWKKTYGGSYDEAPYCAVIDNNSITLACYTRSVDGDVINRIGPASNIDIWIIKMDLNGTLIWQKPIDGSAADFPFQMIKSNGNYFIIGSTLSTDGNFTDNHGMVDTWLAKLDNSGNIIWKKCVGGTKDDNPATLIQLNDGNFLAMINSFSKDGDAAGAPTQQKVKMFYIFKDDGNFVDVRFFGSDIFANGVDIIQREDSSFLIAQHNSTDSVRISFMDANYLITGRIRYGASGSNSAAASGLLMTPGDYLYTIRQTQATTGNVIGNHGGFDFWVLKIKLPAVKVYPKPPSKPYNLQCSIVNTAIKLTWQDTGTTSRSTWIYRSMNDTMNYLRIDSTIPSIKQYNDVTVASNKRYYYKVAGVNNMDKIYSNTCDSKIGVGIKNELEEKFKVYPNPFSKIVTISSNKGEIIETIEVFNEGGQLVERKNDINNATINFETDKWGIGIYYLKIFLSDKSFYQLSITKK